MRSELIDSVLAAIGNEASIVHVETLPSRKPSYAEFDPRLDARVSAKLASIGIERLFSHQAEAVRSILDGHSTMISTGTNSGKSLCFGIPILQSFLTEPTGRSLLIYPTKALAQDQIGKWSKWSPDDFLFAATYDGDTPKSHRAQIRKSAHVVATNPDMLHVGILPGHENWAKFFRSLRHVVIDEAHAYRGVFGSHMAWIVRRLMRICAGYGSRPQIIACSATVANSAEHFQRLTGESAQMIEQDGSASGYRTFFFVNPIPNDRGEEPSRNVETARVLARLADTHVRAIAFSRSRIGVELVLKYANGILDHKIDSDTSILESYRSGYLPEERRDIEQRLFDGRLRGLSATNAMELGVDVGGLDAAIMNGFPGTIASFWQQSGRAGRGSRDAAIVLIANEDPLDQFLAAQPRTLLASESEAVRIQPENSNIASAQLKCAAHERPIAANEILAFGESTLEVAEAMDRSGELQFQSGRFFHPSQKSPATEVDIRGSGGSPVRLMVNGDPIGAMEPWRALQNAHEGAIYLHRGRSFRVESLDIGKREAILVPDEPDYYTQPIVQSVVEPMHVLDERSVGSANAERLMLKTTSVVAGYRVKSIEGNAVLSIHDLELPPQELETFGIRWDLPWLDEEDADGSIGGVHGCEHALSATAPVFAGCDRGDLGSNWYAAMPDRGRPAVFLYDAFPGGMGLCDAIWESIERHWQSARTMLRSCNCIDGCPRCLYSSKCEINNEALNKRQTLRIFE